MLAPVPEVLAVWMRPFQGYFPRAVWRHATGAGGRRPCSRRAADGQAALRVMDLGQAPGFAVHHRVLSHRTVIYPCRRPSALAPAGAAFVPTWPVVVGIDDTIRQRALGAKIKARGIYRDPVRSSRGHFVKASGLRWLCVMLLAPVPWARIASGPLPFTDRAAPSERYATGRGKRHKKLTDWARQALLLPRAGFPGGG